MSALPKDWQFLKSAWLYALALSASQETATDMVLRAMRAVASRRDLVSNSRRKRVLFAMLYREGAKLPQRGSNLLSGEIPLHNLHSLPEPARSALMLLHLSLFSADQIALIIGRPESELPDLITSARSTLCERQNPVR